MIRNTSKVLVIRDGKLLLNQCRRTNGDVYYDLPGGGQQDDETMEEAARREVKEETGYALSELHLAALGEEICTNPARCKQFPDYAHRIFHIFVGKPDDSCPEAPAEKDLFLEKSIWIALDDLYALPELFPKGLLRRLPEILNGKVMQLETYYNDRETV